jgi:putative ABC transport system permease protein
VLTLGLGIGANTAVFSVVHGVVLSPFPFPEVEELVEVRTRYLPPSGFDIDRFPISVPELVDLRTASRSFERLGAYAVGMRTLTGSHGDPERVPTVFLDRQALEALAVEPRIGRWFTTEEDQPGVAVGLLGYDLWVTRYGGDPSVVGSTIAVDGQAFVVTGVMPADFSFPEVRYQLFENFGMDPNDLGNRAAHGTFGIGRLRAGTTLERLEAESRVIHAAWAEEYDHNVAHFPIFERLTDNQIGTDVRRALFVVMGAVAVVLLIAAANVANLLLARGESRLQEVSVRTSLGASRGRVVRQLLTEAGVLAAVGALLGVVMGGVGLAALLRIDPEALPRAQLIGLDGPVLLFTAGVTVAAVALFGVAPALQAGHAPAGALTGATRTTSTGGQRRFRRLLVASEVGLSLVVVTAAGLFGRSFLELTRVDPGVELDGRLVFAVSATGDAYADDAAAVRFFEEVGVSLAAVPGVRAVSATSHLPLSGSTFREDFLIEGRPLPTGEQPMWSAQWTSVLPGYFETMGIPLLRGRLFDGRDGAAGAPAAIVNEAFARRYFADVELESMSVVLPDRIERRIVGIVGNVRAAGTDPTPVPALYTPYDQRPIPIMTLMVRTSGDPALLARTAEDTAWGMGAHMNVYQVEPMSYRLDIDSWRQRFIAQLIGTFALLAMLLGAAGIYSVLTFAVAERTQEIGVRVALGAQRGEVLRMVVGDGLRLALLGAAIGVVGALAIGRSMQGLLYEVSAADPLTMVGVIALLLAVAVVACLVPALRATRVDPLDALRGA